MGLLGFANYDDLKYSHYKWVENALQTYNFKNENKWSQSIAVGSKAFIEKMKGALSYRVKGRKIIGADDTFELRELITPFGNADNLDSQNTYLLNQSIDRLGIYRPLAFLIRQFLHEN
jgi:putative transposase